MAYLIGIPIVVCVLATIFGVPLYCLVSGGIDLAHRRGGWGRIAFGVFWLVGAFVAMSMLVEVDFFGGLVLFVLPVPIVFFGLVAALPAGLFVASIENLARHRGSVRQIVARGVLLLAGILLLVWVFTAGDPGWDDRVLGRGVAPDGREWCVLQSTAGVRGPLARLAFVRNGEGVWLRCAFEPNSAPCREASLEFLGVGAAARIVADGAPGRPFAVPAESEPPAPQRLVSEVVGYEVTQVWHTSCPAEFTPEDILAAHAAPERPGRPRTGSR